jgi:hypothetical protein
VWRRGDTGEHLARELVRFERSRYGVLRVLDE